MADALDILIRVGLENQTDAGLKDFTADMNRGGNAIKETEAALKRLEQTRKSAVGNPNELRAFNAEQAKLNGLLDKTVTGTKQQANAQFALSQILREAPAFAFSFQTGLLGISNNVPILIDRIKDLNAANKELIAQGKAAPSVFSTLARSLGSFGSIATIAISLLTIFGDKLFSSGEAAKEASKDNEDYNKSLKELSESVGKQVADADRLRLIAEDTTLSFKKRSDAVDELQKKFPDYFASLDREKILNGEVGATYDQLGKDILKSAQARGQASVLTNLYTDLTVIQQRILDLQQTQAGGGFVENAAERIAVLQGQADALSDKIETTRKSIQGAQGQQSVGFVNPDDRKAFEEQQRRQKEDALLTEEQRKKRDSDNKRAISSAETTAKRIAEARERIRQLYKEGSFVDADKEVAAIQKDFDEIRTAYLKEVDNVAKAVRESLTRDANINLWVF